MSVIVNLSQKPDDEFRRGLKELSGMPLTSKDFSLMSITDSYGQTDTKIKIRSATQSSLITGEIDRLYTRINITDYLKQLTNDSRIHIWGSITDDTEESGWDKTKKLVYKTLNGDFKINFVIDDLTIVKEGDVFYAEIENLSMTGRAEIYHAGENELTYLSSYISGDISKDLYIDNLTEIDQLLDSSEQLKLDIMKVKNKSGKVIDLTGCTIKKSGPYKEAVDSVKQPIEIQVPVNHHFHREQTVTTEYKIIRFLDRTRSIFTSNGGPTNGNVPFHYPKDYLDIKSEDYPDIVKALNEQFLMNLDLNTVLQFSSFIPKDNSVIVTIDDDKNFTFGYRSWLQWLKPTDSLEEVFPNPKLDMFGGIE